MIFFEGFINLFWVLDSIWECAEGYCWIECGLLKWSMLIFFSKSFDVIIYDANVVALMKQIWEDDVTVASRTFF